MLGLMVNSDLSDGIMLFERMDTYWSRSGRWCSWYRPTRAPRRLMTVPVELAHVSVSWTSCPEY